LIPILALIFQGEAYIYRKFIEAFLKEQDGMKKKHENKSDHHWNFSHNHSCAYQMNSSTDRIPKFMTAHLQTQKNIHT
jgi:hypothetical protein